MMPAPMPPGDPRAPQDYPYDEDRISRAAPTRPYSDAKTSLETALQDAVNGINLSSKRRFIQAKSFCRGAIQKLHREVEKAERKATQDSGELPANIKELKTDLKKIQDEVDAIRPPRPNYGFGINQSARVLEIRSPNAVAPVDSVQENLAPGLIKQLEERDYDEVLDLILDIVWELIHLMVDHGFLEYEMQEFQVEEDIAEEELDDGDDDDLGDGEEDDDG